MTGLTLTDAAGGGIDRWQPPALRYGYTLDDIHHITASALRADRSLAMDYRDRWDIAWSAIVEHLYGSDSFVPTWEQMVRVGWQAIYRAIKDEYRHHGYQDRTVWTGAGSAPRFAQYWLGLPRVTPSPEQPVVERVAAEQIMPTLKSSEAAALYTLAATGDYEAAADALGISGSALRGRLTLARRHFVGLWHQHETPYRPRQTDRRVGSRAHELATTCRAGHPWTPENTRQEGRGAGRTPARRCRACERERDRARRRSKEAA